LECRRVLFRSESNEYAIGMKAEIMVNHFHEQVINQGKIAGKARAMVVTSSIERALEYYYAIKRALKERRSQYDAIVAFSGEKEFKGERLTDIMSRKWTQRIGRNLIFPYRALLAGLSVRRRDISLLLTERIISFTQLYRWSAYNTPFHKQLATCTD